MRGRGFRCATSAFIAIVGSSAAYGQSAAAASEGAQAPSTETGAGLGEIIVTAQRRAESLQRVPISVAAFDPEALAAKGVTDTEDLAAIVPGLTFTKGLSAGLPYLRGVGHVYANLGDESPIAVYIDDVYVPNTASTLFSFPNIERIEVLKGPQGTLFGRNATGGVIHVITREPESTPNGEISLGYANYDTIDGKFYGSTPLGDDAGINLSAVYSRQFDGWGTNQLTGNDAYLGWELGLSSKFVWTPGDRDKLTIRAFYSKADRDFGVASGIGPGALGQDGTPFTGRFNPRKPDNWQKLNVFNASVNWRHDFDWAQLVSISAYHRTDTDILFNNNGIAGNLLPGQSTLEALTGGITNTYTQEIRLESPSTSSFEWMVGLYYLKDITKAYLGVYGTCVGDVCNGVAPRLTRGRQQTDSYSAFGQATIDIFENTRLTAGLRFTRDDKSLSGTTEPLQGRPNSPAPSISVLTPTSFTDDEFTWRLSIDHQLTPDVLMYASYNRGFKSGNYNVTGFTNPPTEPELIDAYEVGLKTELFNRTVRLNGAFFYYDFSDIQLRTSGPPAPPGVIIMYNAAQARIMGFDLDFQALVTPQLNINGGFEYLDAEYTDFPNGTCSAPRPVSSTVAGGSDTIAPCDLSGYQMARAPDVTANIGFTYDIPSSVGTFQIAASDKYSSSYGFDPDGRLRQPSYHDVRASLTWTSVGEGLSASVWIKNAFDEIVYASYTSGAADLALYDAPRTYGITLGAKF